MELGKSPIQHFDRYSKVISAFIKYGFSDIVAHSSLSKIVPHSPKLTPSREGKSVFDLTRYERIRLMLEELGTTYIKFGQLLSNRPDLLPDELLVEMEKFQDQIKKIPSDKIKETLREEYGDKLESDFEYVNYEPLASASIGQVHRARLKNGKEVVLKIKRPGIVKDIKADISIMKRVAMAIEERFPNLAAFQPLDLVKMFEKSILKEVRFDQEVLNMQRFRKNFKDNPHVYVPEVYPDFCAHGIICMEYIEGMKSSDIDAIKAKGLDPKKLAFKGIELYYEQVFEHGFFHADPHPGNFFILSDGRVCFLDFGMMGTVTETDKDTLGALMLAMGSRDVEGMMDVMSGFSTDGENIDLNALEYDTVEFFEEYYDVTIEQIEGDDVMAGLNRMFFDYKIKIPQSLLLLLKALLVIEGVGLHLDPQYNIMKNMEPFVGDLVKRKFRPKALMGSAMNQFKNISYISNGFPKDVQNVLKKLKEGKIRLEWEPVGVDPVLHNMDMVSNRLSFTILLAALIIGSALIVHSGIPPLVNDIPVIGLGGFIISGFFALRLLFSIFRHGKF